MATPEQLRGLAPHFPEIAKALEKHGGVINEQSLCAMVLSLCRGLDANAWQEIESKLEIAQQHEPQEVYLEHLYHYSCKSCKRWWTVADIPPAVGGSFTCPHCGHTGSVGSVKTAETPLRKPTDDLPPAP
jgi:ribosomal protein L37AE/L43A